MQLCAGDDMNIPGFPRRFINRDLEIIELNGQRLNVDFHRSSPRLQYMKTIELEPTRYSIVKDQ
jgi:hypothetical protein